VRSHPTKRVHAAPQAGRLASQGSAPRRLANRSADIGLQPTLAKPKTRRPRHAPVLRGTQETSGRKREALSAVRPARAGGTAAALNARAYRLQKAGRHVEAEPLLREAVRRDPSRAYAQYNLGWSLLSQGKAREALGPLRRTAAQQPERWEPQLRLAQAYAQLGESEKARSAFARARSLQARSARHGRHTLRRAGSRRRSGQGAEGRISARRDKGQTLTGEPTPVQ